MSTRADWKSLFHHYCLCHPNRLRQLTWAAWLLTLAGAVFLARSGGWSDDLKKPMAMGFDSGGHNPLLALTLSRDVGRLFAVLKPEDFHTMKTMLDRDTWFILAYGSLLACLAWRRASAAARAALLLMAAGTMAADFLENREALRLLDSAAQTAQDTSAAVLYCGLKWTLFFATCGAIALGEWFEPLEGGFKTGIRLLAALLLGVGAVTGLTWPLVQNAIIIENASAFITAGLLLLPLWIWNPDRLWH